ncbi:hypothetical protein [Noviherbaspirillum autotrophicum]|uniref:Uncharacterized protein n=1 Tax=Noviherbaspirillum autotrophicum TaxID=709839 RepID=A0A0C2BXU5_9BURK|nr:hypothetical protein [Noviherbaspirillum autotrophicum]KIF82841.1 hypothetical protein TSA66_21670 [Noviherbaspirillum autotrophicum]
MQINEKNLTLAFLPGVWSTDDYIRQWARQQGMAGECIVPLQSLHDEWQAKINFDQDGHPIERIAVFAQPRI